MKLVFALFLLPINVYGAPIIGIENVKANLHGYVIVLKKEISTAAFKSHMSFAKESLQIKSADPFEVGDFKGYSVQATKTQALALAKSEDVDYVEADQTFTLPSLASQLTSRDVQTNAPWNLARISHRAKGSTNYVYGPSSGTNIYVLDTGVLTSHQSFEGRALNGFNAIGGRFDDVLGHGTHIAGTAAGQTYGVARNSRIISVKILDDTGSSSTSTVISGINWAAKDMQTRAGLGSTALLAVGGSYSAALNNAVAAASNAGLFFAVAAGGENTAGTGSPSSEPTACVAGATTIDDAKAPYSNYGSLVDIYAPGSNIISLWNTNNSAVNTISGTSSAAAHIAGLGAYILALEGYRDPVALCQRLRAIATKDVLSGLPAGSSNLLAYNLSGL